MRFVRTYSAVFSITLLITTFPTGMRGLVYKPTLSAAVYNNAIAVSDQLWLMLGGFVIGVAVAQSLFARCHRGRVRAFELAVAVFLGMWVTTGVSWAFATAEWGGLTLALMSGIVSPVVPWTDSRSSVGRRLLLTATALAALASMALSSAKYFDSTFLFFIFAAPIAALGGTLGILGTERIVEQAHERRRTDPAQEDAIRQLRESNRFVA